MAQSTPATSHSSGNALLSVTSTDVFAGLFQLLVFILVVLSIVALVRRYRRSRVSSTGTAQAQVSLTVDLEHQALRDGSSLKHCSRFQGLFSLFKRFGLRSRRGTSFDDTTALLGMDGSPESLPTPVLSSPGPSSLSAISHSRKLFGRICSSVVLGVKPVQPESPFPNVQDGRRAASSATNANHEFAVTEPRPDDQPCHSEIDFSNPTGYPAWVRPHLQTIRDHTYRDWVLTSPTLDSLPSSFSRPFTAIEIPTIIVTPPEEPTCPDPEVSSPASTYSEPDSPTVATPPLESTADDYVYIAEDVEDRLAVPSPTWDVIFEDEEEAENLSRFSGEIFQLQPPPSRKILSPSITKTDSKNTTGLLCDAARTRVLDVIAEEDEPEDELRVVVAASQCDEAHVSDAIGFSATATILDAILEDEEHQDEYEAPRVVSLSTKPDPAPPLDFLQESPVLVTTAVEATNDSNELSASEEEDWEKAFRLGGRLTSAFACPLSSNSLDDDFDEEEDRYSDDDVLDEECHVLHKMDVVRHVEVRSAFKLISPFFAPATEWCEASQSYQSESDDSDADSDSDYHDASSDLASDSSFYSCSGSSFTEEDAKTLDDDCSLIQPSEETSGTPRSHLEVDAALPTALSVLEGYYVEYGLAF
ncbi:hypothetical protein C8Q77DRAFT_1073460 [Trametes polyzona]|nr:hypothetical protein C8Q77DRAFT_1073460 [Trametes polyzona]